eukprot:TRINITY_DN5563_c0_g2_i1.p1 TRINITY_DN5563_c0_g2~~TRINITY_DN5563_c0_g2_i1.p1  ORF type:complete len:1136 (+),score=380.30 TRINITY_DN5563_c0_g2_i1:78-3485(+)
MAVAEGLPRIPSAGGSRRGSAGAGSRRGSAGGSSRRGSAGARKGAARGPAAPAADAAPADGTAERAQRRPSAGRVPRVGSASLPPAARELRRLRQKAAALEAEQQRIIDQAEAERQEQVRLRKAREAAEELAMEGDLLQQRHMIRDLQLQRQELLQREGDAGPRPKGPLEPGTAPVQSVLATLRAEQDDLENGDWVARQVRERKLADLVRRTSRAPEPAARLSDWDVDDDTRQRRAEIRSLQTEIHSLEATGHRLALRRDVERVLQVEVRKQDAADWARALSLQRDRAQRAEEHAARRHRQRLLSANRLRQRVLQRAADQAHYAVRADAARQDEIAADPAERRRLEDSALHERLAKRRGVQEAAADDDAVFSTTSDPAELMRLLREQEQRRFMNELRGSKQEEGPKEKVLLPPLATATHGPLAAAVLQAQRLGSYQEHAAAAIGAEARATAAALRAEEQELLGGLGRGPPPLHPPQPAAREPPAPPRPARQGSARQGSARRRSSEQRSQLQALHAQRRAEREAEVRALEEEIAASQQIRAARAGRRQELVQMQHEQRLLPSSAVSRRLANRPPSGGVSRRITPPASAGRSGVGAARGKRARSALRREQGCLDQRRRDEAQAYADACQQAESDELSRIAAAEAQTAEELEAIKRTDPMGSSLHGAAMTKLGQRLLDVLLTGCAPGQWNNPLIALALAQANATGSKLRLADTFYFDDSHTACERAAILLPARNVIHLVPGLREELLLTALTRLLAETEAGAHPGLLCMDFDGALGESTAAQLEGSESDGLDWTLCGGEKTAAKLQGLVAWGWRCAWVTIDDDDRRVREVAMAVARRFEVSVTVLAHGQAGHDARCDTAAMACLELLGPSRAGAATLAAVMGTGDGPDTEPPPERPLWCHDDPARVLRHCAAQYRRQMPAAFERRVKARRLGDLSPGPDGATPCYAEAVQWLRLAAMHPPVPDDSPRLAAPSAPASPKRPGPAAEAVETEAEVLEPTPLLGGDSKLAQLEARVGRLQRQLDAERGEQRRRESRRDSVLLKARKREAAALGAEKQVWHDQISELERLIGDHQRLIHRLQRQLTDLSDPGPGKEARQQAAAATRIQAVYRGRLGRRRVADLRRPPTPPSRGSSRDWSTER